MVEATPKQTASARARGDVPLFEELLSLLKQRASEHHDARGSVADFVILRLRELDEEAANLVLNVHLLEDRGAVVGDGHVAVRADEHLVHAAGTQRGAQNVGHRARSKDIGLPKGFVYRDML